MNNVIFIVTRLNSFVISASSLLNQFKLRPAFREARNLEEEAEAYWEEQNKLNN